MLPIIARCHVRQQDPFAVLGELLDEIKPQERFYVRNFGNVDLYEDPQHLIVDVELPGVGQKQIHLKLDDGALHLNVEREEEKENKQENYYLRERSSGKWSRSLQLPVAVQEDKVKATFKDGLLRITLEKQLQHQVRNIPIA